MHFRLLATTQLSIYLDNLLVRKRALKVKHLTSVTVKKNICEAYFGYMLLVAS